MFDPLSSSPFASEHDSAAVTTPPWPTTPHPPNSPIPNLRRSLSRPQTPEKSPTRGPFGKEPQIYGQPDQGLISPKAANGGKYERTEPYLRVRITALDRNRRDILVRFDAQTNLPNFTASTYRNVSRSYFEFQQFCEAIIGNNPQTIVPALPLAQTSASTDEEDDRLIKIMVQRWLTRVCDDQFLMRDEETRSFIESDFGYQPTPKVKRKTSSGFSLFGRGVPDEDEKLQQARFELAKLEGQFFDTAKALDKLSRARKAHAASRAEMGNKLVSVASTEVHPPLANALRKIGRTWHSLSDLGQGQSISECVIVGDTFGYQGLNAKSAKETLQQRTHALEDYQQAVKATISKRRHIERLKASSNIRPDKVDEALEDMEEANKYEQILATRVDGISQNLHQALDRHQKLVHDDVTASLIEHTRTTIMYERQFLRELEALRADVTGAARKVAPSSSGPPMPKVVPKLDEDVRARVQPRASGSGSAVGSRTGSPAPAGRPQVHPQNPLARPDIIVNAAVEPPTPSSAGPLSASSNGTHAVTSPPPATATSPLHPGGPLSNGPARPFDGTQSMFITPSRSAAFTPPSASLSPNAPHTQAPPVPPTPPSRSQPISPAGPLGPLGPGGPAPNPLSQSLSSPLVPTASTGMNGGSVDPLSGARINHAGMSQSMYVKPSRPRLDAREAASKLANFF